MDSLASVLLILEDIKLLLISLGALSFALIIVFAFFILLNQFGKGAN